MEVVFNDENLIKLVSEDLCLEDVINFSFSFKKARKAMSEVSDYVMAFVHYKVNEGAYEYINRVLRHKTPTIEFWKRYFEYDAENFSLLEYGIKMEMINSETIAEFFERKWITASEEEGKVKIWNEVEEIVCLCYLCGSREFTEIIKVFAKNGVIPLLDCGHDELGKETILDQLYCFFKNSVK